MAFVYQAQRDLNQLLTSVPPNVGPGSYGKQKKKLIKQSVAPFNTQSTRLDPSKNSSFPGPGSYSVNLANAGQKVLLQSNQSELKILEIHKQQSVFASKCKRFQEVNTSDTPGPGSYKPEAFQRQHYQKGSSEYFIESLLKLNRNKSIPSIPSNEQAYGYVESGSMPLQLNKSPQEIISGLKNDSVGPGHYDLKNSFDLNKEKGHNWHSSKQPKLAPVVSKDQRTIVGPGAYAIENESQPLYKLLPSGSFQSNSSRFNNLDKGQRSKEILRLQFEKKKSKLLQDSQFEDLKDEQFDISQNDGPGPGYYFKDHSTISTKSTSKLETQCFGSKLKRFQSDSNQITVGPGDYKIETQLSNSSLALKQPPFLSSNTRFEQQHFNRRIGPQSYHINKSLEYDLIKKLERSPVGKFGQNQPRFVNDQSKEELPGPGFYDYLLQSTQQGAQTMFKSQTKRIDPTLLNKSEIPAPSQYNPRNHTIEYNIKKEVDDLDFEINRPPFQSSAPRFKSNADVKIDELDEDIYLKKQNQKKEEHKIPYKQKQAPPPFNVQEKRFQYGKLTVQSPGPGEYNESTPWDKPSFNVQYSQF
ncbi:unnamed protein product [Paramecium octaurelia]|uniref:Sperm-tail PG-rich repeat protein n=1 Tax=Paramecium octaurelia TaxID=43137 RepID=A0A8S1XRJ8_PAROT|nr:unnamed protein product [Paramecium octaurelia]